MASAVSEPPNTMATTEDVYLAKEIEMLSDDLSIDMQKYLDEISAAGNFATRKKLSRLHLPRERRSLQTPRTESTLIHTCIIALVR
jgi:hypothetical protein